MKSIQKTFNLITILCFIVLNSIFILSCNKEKNIKQEEYAILQADFSKKPTTVSKNLFGIFYEDINYVADGGLYGEMIQNRSFEFSKSRRHPAYSWQKVMQDGSKAEGAVQTSTESPLNPNNPTYATLKAQGSIQGISNRGYFGLFLEANKTYPGSVYLRSTDESVKEVVILLRDENDSSILAQEKLSVSPTWKKYTYKLTPSKTTEKGRIEVYPLTAGNLDIDMVSLFRADIYKNEENGLRADLAQLLEDMHPSFIRFPGGCVIEGQNIKERYCWKDTIGPVEERKEEINFWGYQ